jgi:hypothetical protein
MINSKKLEIFIMPYTAEISRSHPTSFLFLIDQSGSMADQASNLMMTKAQFVADALNRVVMNLIARSSKAEGIRNYFEIGVIGYGGNGVKNPLQGAFAGKVFNPVSLFEQFPLSVEDRVKKVPDGAGGVAEERIKFPVWFVPEATGGTPMKEGLKIAAIELASWCDDHPLSYPPTVLHVTDGESSDGDPEVIAEQMKKLSTDDGQVLLFNLHTSDEGIRPIKFPVHEDEITDMHGKALYRMSSNLPEGVSLAAREKGYSVADKSKGFFFNVEPIEIVDFFDIGTRASSKSMQLR